MTENDSSTDPASSSDCCAASNGIDADLLQACEMTTSLENESFSWSNDDGGICTRSFDFINTYSLPGNENAVLTEESGSSTEEVSVMECC